ncbi:myosin heavy chain-like isoform 6-T6 [Glossina fuscipes fuscipes]
MSPVHSNKKNETQQCANAARHIEPLINKENSINVNEEQNQIPEQKEKDTKFIERVLLAMHSSKPTPPSSSNTPTVGKTLMPKPSPLPKPLSSVNVDSSASLFSQKTTNASSVKSLSGVACPRPPVPPQAQNRIRKQNKLLPKQSERIPTQKLTNEELLLTKTRSVNYDSDDGLHASLNMRSINYSELASKTTSSSNVATSFLYPIEASLKLPLPKLDKSTGSLRGNDLDLNGVRNLRVLPRSPSPSLSPLSTISSRASLTSSSVTSTISRLQTPPRRVFPQTYTSGNQSSTYEIKNLEQSPVVFDANLSFVLGCKRQPVRQSLRPSPSFEDSRTASAHLSEKIQNFLRRTDHVQEEWTALGRCKRRTASTSNIGNLNSNYYDDYDTISLIERQRERNSQERCMAPIGKSRSSQNILTKAFQLTKTLPRTSTSRSNSLARDCSETEDDRTIQEEDDNISEELSEMAVDLAEERSTANMATERLEAETGERLRLEKELTEQQAKVKSLQESTEKLEMELICARSDLNGISEDEDADNDDGNVGGAGVGVYKLKYEHVARELEFTKRRLQTQHEHDLEQLVGLKKQLEKKLADAYEEVEEQRQIVGQWKRKAQKMTNEMSDLRMLLEEQNARNNLLEKKQRKFDSECQVLQDGARQERQAKERLSREKDILIAEKFTLEQSLADTRLELDLKEEKLSSLQRELEEMTFGGSTEEEIAQLRRSKNELDRRVKEQEEELDEMAGQVQLLEQAKLRLEMSLETMRKEARREAQQRDEELEEARGSAYKKIKALECQLEAEHEERTLLLREKHELERRLSSMEDQDRVDRQVEEAANQKLRRDLRKHKALLKDAQAQLERLKADTPGKALIRQLRNQLEDAESARMLAMKTRQATEVELAEVQTLFEESNRARNEAEDKANTAQRDRAELQSQIEENEEELAELMKKFSATVKQLNTEQVAVSEFEFKISELEAERNNLKEQVMDLQHRLENIENLADPSAAMMSKRLELRTKELESRLELEQTTRTRLEVQMNRHKEALERLQTELSQCKVRELQAQDALKKSQKSFRELREEYQMVSGREQESVTRRKDLEKKIEQFESESTALRNDLRLALQRIADLQQAMEECDDDDLSESEETPSSEASLSDLEERLKPHQSKRSSGQKQNGSSASSNSTATLIREKVDNNPRITLTSPSSTQINKMAAFADKHSTVVNETKKAFRPTVNEPISNGDVSYA